MSQCPYCGEPCKPMDPALRFVDRYAEQARSVTECCGNIVVIVPVRVYQYYKTEAKEDSWGRRAKPSS